MAKRAEIFLRVPQGPPGAPLAENKLLWRRRATVAGEMRGQKKSCLEVEVFKKFVFADPSPQTQPKETRGEGGRLWEGWLGGGRVGLAGAAYPSLTSPLLVVGPYTCLGLPHSPPPTHPSLDIFLKLLDQWTSLKKVFWATGFFLDLWDL